MIIFFWRVWLIFFAHIWMIQHSLTSWSRWHALTKDDIRHRMNTVSIKPVSPHLQFVLCVSDIVVINSEWFLGYFVGNTMWLIAISYYLYITFLGYNGKSCSRLNMLVVFKFFARSRPICCFQGWYLIISNQGYGKPTSQNCFPGWDSQAKPSGLLDGHLYS